MLSPDCQYTKFNIW